MTFKFFVRLLIVSLILLDGSTKLMKAQSSQPIAKKVTNDMWINGFLDRTYKQEVDVPLFCKKCIPLSYYSEGENRVIRLAVGDKDGNFNAGGGLNYSGLSTIKELNPPIGGILIEVRIVKNTNGTSVGIKVGDGNRKLSEAVHQAIKNALATNQSQK